MQLMEVSTLMSIGLTKGEAQVYLALLRIGQTKTGRLAAEAGVSSSKVYKILDRLEKKGLVGHVLKQKIKHFIAVPPRRILDYLQEKRQEFAQKENIAKNLIPLLEAESKQVVFQDEASIYEGFKAVQNLYKSMIDELKRGDVYHIIGAGYIAEILGMKPFFQDYHTERAKRGIKVKMLANNNVRGSLVPATSKLSEIRFLPQYLMTNMSILFYKDKAFIVLWARNPKAFLIHNQEIVQSFRTYFDVFWKIARA